MFYNYFETNTYQNKASERRHGKGYFAPGEYSGA